jgi:nitrogen fixation/metabolism regulation signal transduction histidine kinase
MDAGRFGEDRAKFPNASDEHTEELELEAQAIPVSTDQGRWYVMVILRNDRKEAFFRTVTPLFYTLAVLLTSTLAAVFLVRRFTLPIANLSEAARRVAEGDLHVRVADDKRGDEIGMLASRFNEMTAELEKKRELEDQLQKAEKSAVVGRLASAIAHEIRNPLNYINLTLDHLSAKFRPEAEEQRKTFDNLTSQLKSEVGRINQQVSDFLRYSRPIKLSLQPIAVHEVINDSLRIVEAQAKEQNVKIGIVERENVSKISGDAEALRSVFNNLFINALQAMETNGGNLSVTISPDSDFVKIDVADTGTGIPLENLPKIFEPYFSTKETGTGLGLAIVKRIVEDHSGKIEVESESGKGTRFSVSLPSG